MIFQDKLDVISRSVKSSLGVPGELHGVSSNWLKNEEHKRFIFNLFSKDNLSRMNDYPGFIIWAQGATCTGKSAFGALILFNAFINVYNGHFLTASFIQTCKDEGFKVGIDSDRSIFEFVFSHKFLVIDDLGFESPRYGNSCLYDILLERVVRQQITIATSRDNFCSLLDKNVSNLSKRARLNESILALDFKDKFDVNRNFAESIFNSKV